MQSEHSAAPITLCLPLSRLSFSIFSVSHLILLQDTLPTTPQGVMALTGSQLTGHNIKPSLTTVVVSFPVVCSVKQSSTSGRPPQHPPCTRTWSRPPSAVLNLLRLGH
nr:hypothetical protein Itr_chr12CG18440 [Ipomoea trifida]